MPFMMKMMNRILLVVCAVLVPIFAMSQSEGLTSSPYSLYGLGIINQTSIGKTNSMGYSGIGLKSGTDINNLNPSNYSLVPKNSFFYDIGVVGEFNSYSNRGDDESKTTLNFSNLAFAFRMIGGASCHSSLTPGMVKKSRPSPCSR